MGNRVKGRVKKKSIKAAIHSGSGTKRKLSRMGKKQQRHKSGLDACFIGRSACLKRLQISLKDFRRLCILKGVYPREPRGRAPRNRKGQVYYHLKDVRAIAHEPLLRKFREFKTFMRRVRRAAGRNEKDEAARLRASAPEHTLHHLVRERYPRFVDALEDLDDALALTFLFAALPSARRVTTRTTARAAELAAAWSAYCALTSSVTKTFVSVKGVYVEANVRGTAVRWIVPHAFAQSLPPDVDYRVMGTFFEFYDTLLSFVLFKLYKDVGVRYPLRVDVEEKRRSDTLLASHLRVLGRALRSNREGVAAGTVTATAVEHDKTKERDDDDDDKEETSKDDDERRRKRTKALLDTVSDALRRVDDDEDDDMDEDVDEDVDVSAPLKEALEGVHDDDVNDPATDADDPLRLTSDALRRRKLFAGLTFFLSREVPRGYLELVCLSYGAAAVGWEGDDSPIKATDASVTHHVVDRPKLLSSSSTERDGREYVQPQWILDSANHDFRLPCDAYGVGKTLPPHLSPWVNDEEEGYVPAYAETIRKLKNGETLEETKEDETDDDDDDDEKEKDDAKEDDVVEEEDEVEETKAESTAKQEKKRKAEDKETHDLAKLMMSKKATRLYGRMQHGLSAKKARVEELQRRRQEIESTRKKDDKGRTPLKQKVDRLKDERRALEKDYDHENKKREKKRRRTKQQQQQQQRDATTSTTTTTTTTEKK